MSILMSQFYNYFILQIGRRTDFWETVRKLHQTLAFRHLSLVEFLEGQLATTFTI